MWEEATFRARIESGDQQRRFPATSPDGEEIAIYRQAVSGLGGKGHALVLGMTPELRCMAGAEFDRLTAVDASAPAIDIYRDWVGPGIAEEVVLDDWGTFLRRHPATFSAVFGDGIFGNVPSGDDCLELVDLIRRALCPGGVFVTRMAVVPPGFRAPDWEFQTLLRRFRDTEIDEAEFSLSARLFGYFEKAYDSTSSMLDNARVFDEIDAAAERLDVTDAELGVLRRSAFRGLNFLPDVPQWEEILTSASLDFGVHPPRGKLWHQYYRIYTCRSA
ncbi:class I SAM-dependent methyltransferase [Rhodococcus daqingensis]|uniref:Class I SAM-dependent methyltransferase n=1 Tax=Rhodococcus daqingensis TaxID=2479363 RepID=A0ABW2RW24_9NOCA